MAGGNLDLEMSADPVPWDQEAPPSAAALMGSV
jgi:hypothetical protein